MESLECADVLCGESSNGALAISPAVGLKDIYSIICNTLFFSYKNMIFRSEPQKEIEIATNKITTMFLNFDESKP